MSTRLTKLLKIASQIVPGTLIAISIAALAHSVGIQTGIPSILVALVFGLCLNPFSQHTLIAPGITYTSRGLLRLAVALLGARLSYDLIAQISPHYLILTFMAVALTLIFGVLLSKWVGVDRSLGILTGGSVAICGASAAVAIAAVLPYRKTGERELATVIISVTVLSTIAMLIYPIIASILALSETESGVFFGATIHDVAQVVGAGLMVSEDAGTFASFIKLFRVSLLAPVVLGISLYLVMSSQSEVSSDQKRPTIPAFVVMFICLGLFNTLGLLPLLLREVLVELSAWGLLASITAVGMKTSINGLWSSGPLLLLLVMGETVFLALFVLVLI